MRLDIINNFFLYMYSACVNKNHCAALHNLYWSTVHAESFGDPAARDASLVDIYAFGERGIVCNCFPVTLVGDGRSKGKRCVR